MNPASQHHHEAWSWEPPNLNLHRHYQRESMFEKSLTPSDVGKLNRLVIPKQHAEKYFPLDGDSGEKDLLLSFEDEAGKPWRFRYSYWNSSQSYVLTKGWSRFVKEKKLDAGDVILFERMRAGSGDRFFIMCRRQGASESPPPWSRVQHAGAGPHPASPGRSCSCTLGLVQEDYLRNAGDQREEVAVAPANSKRLRLFGVNLN